MLAVKKKLKFSTQIKDAGIAIHHSRGYIISILQGPEMGRRSGHQGYKSTKIAITRQRRIQNAFYAENSISGRREAFGTGPEPQNGPKTYEKCKNAGLGP